MDLASFQSRYPSFTNDIDIQQALDDASLMITMYDIDADKFEMATALMAAHLLTLLPTNGTAEQVVTKVKADTVEVEFSDKASALKNWFQSTTYGWQLELLIRPSSYNREYGVINDYEKYAINFYGYSDHDQEPRNF